MSRGAATAGLGREFTGVAAAVVVGIVMTSLDTTITSVALPTLAAALDAPVETIQWVATGYLLALAAAIPLSGWTAERFGARRVWIVALTVYGSASALCALSWSAPSLIGFRLVQGLGGGLVLPVGMSMLARAAGPERFGRVTALVGAPLLIGPVLGPMIGGLIVDSASWRWMFTVNVPMTVLALGLALRLPEGGPRSDPGRLDWLGAALLSPGLAAVVLGLARAQSLGTPADPTAFVPLLVGAGLLAWFVRHALPAARPLIDIRLLQSRSVAAAAAVVFLGNGAFFAAWLILPLYLQLARGQSPLDTGLLMAPQGLGVALAMPFAGRLTDRFGGGRVALFGVVAGVFANLPFIWLAADTSFVLLATALVLRGIAFGAMLMPAMAAAYAVLRPAEIPAATSVLTVAQRIGGSAAAALATAVIGRELAAAPGTPSAGPFGSAFAWIAAMLALATIPAVLLALERPPRRGERQPPETFAVDPW